MKITFSFIIWIIIILKNYCKCEIRIIPKSNVLQGEKVTISCTFIDIPRILIWYLNDNQVAENAQSYNKTLFEIIQIKNRFDLVIRNASLNHRGNWKCGDKFSVQLHVAVPWTLRALQIKKVTRKSNNLSNVTCKYIETGEKAWPYMLLKNETLIITCKSECGLPGPKSISVQYSNSTKEGELSGGTQKYEKCLRNPDLENLIHNISINCHLNGLAGRNDIRCQAQDTNGNLISTKPVYIICPASSKADILTRGEMVAIAVSIVLAILDIIIIVYLLRRNCREMSHSRISHYKFDKSNGSEVML